MRRAKDSAQVRELLAAIDRWAAWGERRYREPRRARDAADVRELLAWMKRAERRIERHEAIRPPAREPYRASHPLGAHVWIVIRTALDCQPDKTEPEQADAMLAALGDCLDLASAVPASRPRDATPTHPHFANRMRMSGDRDGRPVGRPPMNPVQRHYSSGESTAPTMLLDSAHWQREYRRVDIHFDRCEVVRRAAVYLASLLDEPRACLKCRAAAAVTLWTGDQCPLCGKDSPPVARAVEDEQQLRERIAVEARGHPLHAAAERFDRRSVIQARLEHGQHPVRGVPWTPPADNHLAAHEARAMRDEGLTSTDIARALGRGAATVRNWTTKRRLAA